MTDRLLTPDALRDIAVKYHPDQLYALYLGADVNVNDYHTKRSVDAHYTDIPALLAHIRAQAQRIAVLEADAYQRDVATRQDERNATIKDMRRHLADELRKLGLCDQETISLTEVVYMVRQQNDRIAALEDALLCVASMVGVEEATIPPGSTPADVAGLIRDALAAENARLRDALAAVCDQVSYSLLHHSGVYHGGCNLCGTGCDEKSGEITHVTDCPIAAARALLEGGA